MSEKSKPVKELRVGAVKAAIWANQTANGTKYSVTFGRLFKDGEEWKQAESFNRDDLLVLAKVADQAHTWVSEAQQKEPKGQTE